MSFLTNVADTIRNSNRIVYNGEDILAATRCAIKLSNELPYIINETGYAIARSFYNVPTIIELQGLADNTMLGNLQWYADNDSDLHTAVVFGVSYANMRLGNLGVSQTPDTMGRWVVQLTLTELLMSAPVSNGLVPIQGPDSSTINLGVFKL